jgi:hypothetical protein
MNNEQWTDDILDSLRGAKRAEPNPFLFTRIVSSLEGGQAPVRISLLYMRMAVSVFILVVAFNVTLLVRYAKSSPENTESTSSGYELSSRHYQLY